MGSFEAHLSYQDIAGERGINNATPRTAGNTTPTTFRAFAEETVRPALVSSR